LDPHQQWCGKSKKEHIADVCGGDYGEAWAGPCIEKYKKALETEDENSCKSAEDPCIADVAVLKKDVSICSKMVYQRDQCATGVAIVSKDENLCQNAREYPTSEASCRRVVGLSIKAMGESKTFCNNNDTCVSEVLKKRSDLESCSELFVGEDALQCKKIIAVKKNDSTLCPSNGIQHDECYTRIGIATNDAKLCPLVGDFDLQRECNYRIAESTKDDNLCALLPESSSNDFNSINCYNRLGTFEKKVRGSNDPVVCEVYKDKLIMKDWCLWAFIEQNPEKQYCELLSGAVSTKEFCYEKVANRSKR